MPAWFDAWGAITAWGGRVERKDPGGDMPKPSSTGESLPKGLVTEEVSDIVSAVTQAAPTGPGLAAPEQPEAPALPEVEDKDLESSGTKLVSECVLDSGDLKAASAALGLQAGETIECWCSSHSSWIPAKVLTVNPNGSFTMDCGLDLPQKTLWRKAAQTAGHDGEYQVGDAVEYLSSSQKAWVPARVVAVGVESTYTLDCKPDVPREKIRPRAGAAAGPRGGGKRSPVVWWLHTSGSPEGGLAVKEEAAKEEAEKEEDSVLMAGESVMYLSKTQGTWIPAKVLAVNLDGTYKLDCKPDAPADRVFRQAPHPSSSSTSNVPAPGARHEIGDGVEYFSASWKAWIPAKVVAVNENGTYRLDCKPDVPPEKIRALAGRAGGHGGGEPRGEEPPSVEEPRLVLPAPKSRAAAPQPASRQGSFDALQTPAQLLAARCVGGRWVYRACTEGLDLLKEYGERPVVIVSLFTLHGSGKGLLLNLLLERVQRGLPLFRTCSHSQDNQGGLWLWGFFRSEEPDPVVALVDCDGTGDGQHDCPQDSQLMALCLLLSSVLVLATKGARGLAALLALCHRAAARLGEGPPGGAERPALLWLLRDVLREGPQPDEYLEQALRQPPRAPSGEKSELDLGPEAGGGKQDVRRCFGLRSCATLAQPAASEEPFNETSTLDIELLSSDFLAGVRSLRAQLLGLCRGASAGRQLPGRCLAAALEHAAEALNSNAALNIEEAKKAADNSACAQLVQELRAAALREFRALAAGETLPGGARLPMSDEALSTILRDQRHKLKNQWDERAVGPETVRREYWLELKEALARDEGPVRQRNAQIADRELQEVLGTWQAWLEDSSAPLAEGEQISRDLGQLMERMPSAHALRVSRTALEVAARRVANARAVPRAGVRGAAAPRGRSVSWHDEKLSQEEAQAQHDSSYDVLAEKSLEVSRPERTLAPSRPRMRKSSRTPAPSQGDKALPPAPCEPSPRLQQERTPEAQAQPPEPPRPMAPLSALGACCGCRPPEPSVAPADLACQPRAPYEEPDAVSGPDPFLPQADSPAAAATVATDTPGGGAGVSLAAARAPAWNFACPLTV